MPDSIQELDAPQSTQTRAPNWATRPLVDVVLCAGQSNMVGEGDTQALPDVLKADHPTAQLFHGGTLKPLAPGTGHHNQGFGPEISLGHTLAARWPHPVVLVKVAKGDTDLATDWSPAPGIESDSTGHQLYGKLLAAAQAAGQALWDQGLLPRFSGLVWYQGESDCKNDARAHAYKNRLTDFLAQLRRDLDAPQLPAVLVRVNPRWAELVAHRLPVRHAIESVANHDPNAHWVDIDDLHLPDDLHLDAHALLTLGDRCAALLPAPAPGSEAHNDWDASDNTDWAALGLSWAADGRFESDVQEATDEPANAATETTAEPTVEAETVDAIEDMAPANDATVAPAAEATEPTTASAPEPEVEPIASDVETAAPTTTAPETAATQPPAAAQAASIEPADSPQSVSEQTAAETQTATPSPAEPVTAHDASLAPQPEPKDAVATDTPTQADQPIDEAAPEAIQDANQEATPVATEQASPVEAASESSSAAIASNDTVPEALQEAAPAHASETASPPVTETTQTTTETTQASETAPAPAPKPSKPALPRPKETRVIALINQKGGVGKTTTTVNLGAALAERGQRVLLVDLDPQAHLTLSIGLDPDSLDLTIYDLMADDDVKALEVCQEINPNLAILPADVNLAGIESELAPKTVTGMAQQVLKHKCQSLYQAFDYVLIDCPPALGLLTINGLTLAKEVIVPMQAHFLALQGLGKLLETVQMLGQGMNAQLKVSGIVLCMHEANTVLANEVVGEVQGFLDQARGSNLPWANATVYSPPIRRNIKLAEAPSFGESVFAYAPESNGAADYARLAESVATQTV